MPHCTSPPKLTISDSQLSHKGTGNLTQSWEFGARPLLNEIIHI